MKRRERRTVYGSPHPYGMGVEPVGMACDCGAVWMFHEAPPDALCPQCGAMADEGDEDEEEDFAADYSPAIRARAEPNGG